MAYSASTLIQRCRRFMGDWPDLDQTTASVSSSGTTLSVADSTLYAKNWTVQLDQEAMFVSALPSATTLTVRRGMMGTTAASHASSASVLIRPAFIDQEYLDSLNAAIAATFPLIYRPVVDESLASVASTYEYTIPNMPGSYDGTTIPIPYLYEVQVKETGDLAFRRKKDWEVLRGTTPTLKFRRDEPTGTIRLRGYGPMPPLASFTDTLDSLYPVNAVHALIEYACGRLLASGEARRVRVDAGAVDQREQANRTGSSSAQGRDLLQRFYASLNSAAMPPLPRHVRATF
jgi:hypothetical protein